MSIRLSKSQLDKFISCPKCFWLKQRHKLDQPDMISSKVWKGIERVALAHYEVHRQVKKTPSNLIGQVPPGAIPYQADRIDMKALRYWGKGLRFTIDGVEVTTALDDMLQCGEGVGEPKEGDKRIYNCIDLKSKSKPTDLDSTIDLYQNQADVYDLAMNVNGYPTDGIVYFDYWYPMEVDQHMQNATAARTIQIWGSQVIALKADHERIKKLILEAAACLDSAMPDPSGTCVVCSYVKDRAELMDTLRRLPKQEKEPV